MLRLIPYALAFVGACADPTEQPVVGPATGLPALVVTVDRANTASSSRPKLWLRRAGTDEPVHRATVGDFDGGSEPVRFENLEPGLHELACRLPFGLNGPWITTHHRVRIEAGAESSLTLALPAGSAQLRVVPEPYSPPYFLALTDPDLVWPADLRDVQRLLHEERYPKGVHFTLQKDGSPHRKPLPMLPAGDYQVMVIANDWQTGDPPVLARTVAISLREGQTTTLNLDGKLTRLSVK